MPNIDLSRTVGWFTSIFSVHLQIDQPHDLGEALKTVKESLRQIPHKGIGQGILTYLASKISPPLGHSLQPSLSFNYLGQWDNTTVQEGLFAFASESTGASVSDQNNLSHLLNINCEVKGQVLRIFWTYSSNHYHEKTIQSLSWNFLQRLKQLIKHCSENDFFDYTPSDFNLTKNKNKKLEKRLNLILGETNVK